MKILAPLNVMADIETPSTLKSAAILSIAAVAFDDEGRFVGHPFYITISLQSNLKAGRTVDEDCLCNFWIQKCDDDVRKEAFSGTCELLSALDAFDSWFKHMERISGKSGVMWGNGSEFDNAIIEDAFKGFDRPAPWKFWASKCYRTVKGMYKEEVPMHKFEGKHNALTDATEQAKHLVRIDQAARSEQGLLWGDIDLAANRPDTTKIFISSSPRFSAGGPIRKPKKVKKRRNRVGPFVARAVRLGLRAKLGF